MDISINGPGEEVMHSIGIRLYPSYLPGCEKAYVARTVNDASLSIEDVCTSLSKRGGFTGEYKDLVNHVKQYLDEAVYQLCDGYSINTGYFSMHPNVGGIFKDVHDKPEEEKNPLTIRFQQLKPLRNAVNAIRIVSQGLAATKAHIREFIDTDENAVNSIVVPGNAFIIIGEKIKLVGDEPECGLFFVPVDDPSQAVRATRIIENNPLKLIGITPEISGNCRVEVRTLYSSNSVNLRNVRCISSNFILEVV